MRSIQDKLCILMAAVVCIAVSIWPALGEPQERRSKHNQDLSIVGDRSSQEDKDWAAAINTGTPEAIEDYLKKYPKGTLTPRTKILQDIIKSDILLREKDKTVIEGLKKRPDKGTPAIPAATLGSDYALWRSLTSTETARVQFTTPKTSLSIKGSLIALSGKRKWLPVQWPSGTSRENITSSLSKFMPFEQMFNVWPPVKPIELIGYQGRPEALFPGDQESINHVTILDGSGYLLLMPTTMDNIPLFGNQISRVLVPTAGGSIHLFKGDVQIFGLRFNSSESDPLRFLISDIGDYLYVGGKGTVLDRDGKAVFQKNL